MTFDHQYLWKECIDILYGDIQQEKVASEACIFGRVQGVSRHTKPSPNSPRLATSALAWFSGMARLKKIVQNKRSINFLGSKIVFHVKLPLGWV